MTVAIGRSFCRASRVLCGAFRVPLESFGAFRGLFQTVCPEAATREEASAFAEEPSSERSLRGEGDGGPEFVEFRGAAAALGPRPMVLPCRDLSLLRSKAQLWGPGAEAEEEAQQPGTWETKFLFKKPTSKFEGVYFRALSV